jgi:hypothetical protein
MGKSTTVSLLLVLFVMTILNDTEAARRGLLGFNLDLEWYSPEDCRDNKKVKGDKLLILYCAVTVPRFYCQFFYCDKI